MKACLTLILPQSLEEPLLDHLLHDPQWIGPFTAHPVDGHGGPGAMASVAEQVRGRSRRVRIEALIEADHATEIVSRLRASFQGAEVFWWLSPVLDSGSLA